MVIDIHVHYGFLFFPIEFSGSADLIEIMDRYGINISIVSNLRGIFYDFRNRCNAELADEIAKYPDRLKGFIVVNPNYLEESLEELEKYSKTKGFVGVKLHASWHNKPIDGPEFEPIFSKCEELHLPVLIHSYVVDDYSDQVSCPERVANAARRHPGLQIVLAHMGGNARRTLRAVKCLPNISVDISTGRENAGQMYVWELGRVDMAVQELGAERVLFGSDCPLIDPAICFGLMDDSNLGPCERELIMWKNAVRIFGI